MQLAMIDSAYPIILSRGGGGKEADGTDYFSPRHFEYVIQQLTRIRTEINTHFDEQAKRENELKVLLNKQVNEVGSF